MDNKTWNAADPSPACKVDGLYGNYGLTWGRKCPGYTLTGLQTLPRVKTETGCTIEGQVTEEVHASVKVFDPTVGTEPVQTLSGIDSLDLTLSDHPLIIAIPRK
ncbi:MAG: hypothetical protein ACLQU3_18415 [Limisphaerales bacterium]